MKADKAKFLGLALLLALGRARAEVFTFDRADEWRTWQLPAGVVEVLPQGAVQLTKYRKNIDPLRDAALFTHPTQKRGEVQGGIWNAGSNARDAERIIDGDARTFWKPDPGDDPSSWVVEIDLGRAVLARGIRLRFPDQEGARPFRQFSVYTATGARIQVSDDVFKYEVAYRTTQPNADTLVSFYLAGADCAGGPEGALPKIAAGCRRDTTYVLEEGLEVDAELEGAYRVVQFIRITADEPSPEAALAEVEVVGVGDNASIGILARGGSFANGLLAREPQNMFDGQMDTFGNVFTVFTKGGWKESGVWWQVDLGALFWIDEIFLYWKTRGEALSFFLSDGFNVGEGYELLYSDGRRTTSGDIDFTSLLVEPVEHIYGSGKDLRHFRYMFKPRKIRYFFWHSLTDQGWYSHPMEFMLFSPGHPAQAELRSGFIDLGEWVGDRRPKAIRGLSWAAEQPAGTRLQLRSRSGNTLQEVYAFHDKLGNLISESEWNSKPKVVRGPVDTAIVAGDDWDEWSNFYQFSGEAFKSDSPRRYLQLELILSTEDPQVTPLIRSLSIEFEDALVQEAAGLLLPRQAPVNQETRFAYTVWPQADARDSGFDRLRLRVPSAVDTGGVETRVGGAVLSSRVFLEGDSLLVVDLPSRVKADSVTLSFDARVLRNATVFELELGDRGRPGLWQSVPPAQRQGNVVFLPELARSRRLIGDLEIVPVVFTPNGDGINDQVEIRFAVLKAAGAEPRVRIFDLAGRRVAELPDPGGGDRRVFTWAGRDQGGALVPPGTYLCFIQLSAEAGENTIVRTLALSY
jgi:hypothetical protein